MKLRRRRSIAEPAPHETAPALDVFTLWTSLQRLVNRVEVLEYRCDAISERADQLADRLALLEEKLGEVNA